MILQTDSLKPDAILVQKTPPELGLASKGLDAGN
jgi:hypothetical protein